MLFKMVEQFFHTVLGFCLWDLLGLAILAAVGVMLAIYIIKQKHRQRELEQELVEEQIQDMKRERDAREARERRASGL